MSEHLQYAEDVVAGRILTGDLVRRQCERVLREHEASPDRWEFKPEFCVPILNFISSLSHVKGQWARREEQIKLEPWQVFFICETYGWVDKDTWARRYREAILEVARKNAKTTILAGLGLFELMYGDAGAEVYSVATKQDQAKIVWDIAGQMVRRIEPEDRIGVKQTVSAITTEAGDTFAPLSKETKTLDGLSPSLVIIDEAAAIEKANAIEVMLSGMGARENPLAIYITTAGFNRSTLYYTKRSLLVDRLKAGRDMGRLFGMLYQIDPDDDWRDPNVWIKANPNLNVSVMTDHIADQVEQATEKKQMVNGVLVKHMCRWVGAGERWLDADDWDACAVPRLQRAGKCYVGIDLASFNDLTSVVRIWPRADGQIEMDHHSWLPQRSFDTADESAREAYAAGQADGVLTVVDTAVVDYSVVRQYLEVTRDQYGVTLVGSDGWNAQTLVEQLENDGFQILEVTQSIKKMNQPSKTFGGWVAGGKLRHLGDDLLAWQAGNCEAWVDVNDNVKIRKGDDPSRKVDSIIAAIIATACYETGVEPEDQVTWAVASMDE